MPLPTLRGISAAYQHALIELIDDLLDTPELDDVVRRRGQWFKWGLEGRQPGSEPLPFVDDAGPLVPAIGGAELMLQE